MNDKLSNKLSNILKLRNKSKLRKKNIFIIILYYHHYYQFSLLLMSGLDLPLIYCHTVSAFLNNASLVLVQFSYYFNTKF